jgi:hypothetical protein
MIPQSFIKHGETAAIGNKENEPMTPSARLKRQLNALSQLAPPNTDALEKSKSLSPDNNVEMLLSKLDVSEEKPVAFKSHLPVGQVRHY